MSNEISKWGRIQSGFFRFVDVRQPEVKWAIFTSGIVEIFLVFINLHSNFSLYANDLGSLLQDLIGALVSLIGVAISGVAIVIALFSREQVDVIEKLKNGAFEDLLTDFKWLALISALDTAVFICIVLIIKTPYPLAPSWLFYLITFLVVYSFFYLLFYGYALIGNCIKMAKLKNTLERISSQSKSVPITAIEFQIDFLISRLLKGNKEEARKYYAELIGLAEKSRISNKNELLSYLNERYSEHIKT